MPLIEKALSTAENKIIINQDDWVDYLIIEDKNSSIIGYHFKDKHHELRKISIDIFSNNFGLAI